MENKLKELLPDKPLQVWRGLTSQLDLLYDMDKLYQEHLRRWEIEYKYRRGGKTLCTFYAKKGAAYLLIVYGKAEQAKLEQIKTTLSPAIQALYDGAKALHDGKWLLIPLDETTVTGDILAMLNIKRKPNRK